MKYEFKLNGINEPKEIHVMHLSLCGDHRANLIQKFQFQFPCSTQQIWQCKTEIMKFKLKQITVLEFTENSVRKNTTQKENSLG